MDGWNWFSKPYWFPFDEVVPIPHCAAKWIFQNLCISGSGDVLSNVQIGTDSVFSKSRPSGKSKTELDNAETIKTRIPLEVPDTQTGLNPDEVFKRSTLTRRSTPYLTQKDGEKLSSFFLLFAARHSSYQIPFLGSWLFYTKLNFLIQKIWKC